MLATRCEDLWDALFPCRPLARLSSSRPGRNHLVVPSEFDRFWQRVVEAQREDAGGVGRTEEANSDLSQPKAQARFAVHSTGEQPQKAVGREYAVVIERDDEGFYVGSVPQLPGCHTQAGSLDELMERIHEAIALYLDAQEEPPQKLEFIGVQRVTVAA
jgi:predicted RNase H-like HicB family nuclease